MHHYTYKVLIENMEPNTMLIERFISPSAWAPFEDYLQKLHKQDVVFWNINLAAFYTAFFLSTSCLVEHGDLGKKFGVANVLVQILSSETNVPKSQNAPPGIYKNYKWFPDAPSYN